MRRAGQHAREKTRNLAIRGLIFLAAIFAVSVLAGLVVGFGSWAFIGVEVLAIGVMLLYERRYVPVVDRWDRGATGEEHVGKLLDELGDSGWHVLHDVSLGRGNIDHVLVGPAGLITVETKSHGGRIFIESIDERMLKQAYAQAKAISELTGEKASALLVFSRAYLYPRPVSRQRGVVVLPARMLAGHLARRPAVLSVDQAAAIHGRLVARLASG